MNLFRNIILIFTLLGSFFTIGQSDFITWAGLELKTSVSKKIELNLKGQSRFDRNSSHLKNTFISPGIRLKVHKNIRLSGKYRLSSIPFNLNSSNRILSHRLTLDAQFRNLLNLILDKPMVDLNVRLRGTHEMEKNKRDDHYIRLRLKGALNLKKSKITPNASLEIFYHLNNQITYTFEKVTSHHAINKLRIRIGTDYKLNKRQELSFFGIYQRELFRLENDFILGVGYTFELKK
ncbi:MAG: DUF2490 domain-containing protein [Crocinitomicaceae bacterium]|nr:DUF2490 domain-containing protein [Crocinitomicaceae bacterium]